MFKLREIAVILIVASLVCPHDSFARGGRGGGGGMSRGSSAMSRSPSMSRPSMPSQSRPSSSRPQAGGAAGARPSQGAISSRPGAAAGARPGGGAATRPGSGIAAGARPSAGQLQSFLNLPAQGARTGGAGLAAGTLPAGGNAAVADFFHGGAAQATSAGSIADNRADRIGDRTDARSDLRDSRGENRDFASDNRQDRVEGRGDRQSVRVENRGDYRSNLAEGRGDRRTERQQQLGDHADGIRDALYKEFDQNHLFEDFWLNNPHAYYHFQKNPVFWTWATFNTVAAFMPWNWGTGAYYDYGSGGSSSSSDAGTVYTDEATYSSPEYAEQAEELAASAPEEPPADTEWLSLGVFAATADDNRDALPNMFLQLVVSKDGILAGTYQNKTTGKTESLEGMVDKESQRAAWTISGKNTPIMETGLANLTMNETRALVHFADGTTQQWLLIRVAKPDDAGTAVQP